jgi:iron complex outermembrane recepter protein
MIMNGTRHFWTWILRPAFLAGAALLTAASICQPAYSQSAPPTAKAAEDTTLSEVVVTGYRASLASAIEAKRSSNNIVDVIKADDIASFPDANLAESMQRIPGVSITRDGGEGRNITVRGLGGDFVRTLLNGIDAYSATTGSTLGVVAGINRTRGFDYSTFASELFNSITVSKSQSAEMDEGSLAATVDLQTPRPFDKSGLRAAASVQGAYYDNNSTTSPRLTGLISNTWGNFGALFSVAYSKRKAQEDGYSDTSQSDYSDALNGFCGRATDDPNQPGSQVINTAIPYVNVLSGTGNRPANQCFSGLPSDPVAYSKVNQPNVFLPRNPGLGRFILDQKRLGMTGALQYRLSSETLLTLDAVYSQFDQDRTDYALSQASNNRNVNGASAAFPLFAGRVDSQLIDVNVTDSGQVDYMKINNVDVKHIQELSNTTTKTHEVGLTFDTALTDRLHLNAKVGHAGSDFDQPWDVFVSYDAFNKQGYIWDSRNDVRRPYINYGYDVTNLANVTFTNAGTGLTPDIRIVEAQVKNNLATGALNLKFDFNNELAFKTGVMYKKYKFDSRQIQRASTSPNNGTDLTKFGFAAFAADFPNLSSLSTNITNWGSQLGLPPGSVTSWVVPDTQQYIDKLNVLCNCVNKYGDWTLNTSAALANNRLVEETDTGIYTQADFSYPVFGDHTLRGNVGVRYAKTKVESTGFTGTTLVSVPNSYDDWLPSLNASLDLKQNLIARVAYSKVMARPGLGNLNPGGSINTTFGAQNATIGNPLLDPYRASNYDLSFEWYPGQGTLLGMALFYKDVGSTIQNITALEPYGNTGLPISLLPPGQDATTIYTVTRSRNSPGGYIEGVELNWQQPFTFLPRFWSNFGTSMNYTYVKSRVVYYLSTAANAPVTHDQFVNVSPNSVNATLYYDDKKFSAHVSLAYRDDYIIGMPFKAGIPEGYYGYPTTNVDASFSFALTDRVKITGDALNLTNQPGDQYSGATRKAQRVYSTTGRQFFLGISYVMNGESGSGK